MEDPAVDGRWGTGRTEAFSDGVFAIAITLLVLDLRVPATEFADLPRGIVRQWPSYLAFATSFLTIGAIWIAHHAIFRRLRSVDATVLRLNLLLLMLVSLLPFPTKLMGEAMRDTNAERAAVIFYGGALLAVTFVLSAMWRAVAGRRDLLAPDVGEDDVRALLRATAPNVGFYAIAVGLAIVAPRVAAFSYLVIALLIVLWPRVQIGPPVARRSRPPGGT